MPPAAHLAPDDPRVVQAASHHAKIKEAVWQAFIGQFEQITSKPGVDFVLLNKAAIGAFIDCAVRVAVDDGMSEDTLADIMRQVHRVAFKAAPRFG